jgi:hypothetical protein
MEIRYVAVPPGAGKTTAALNMLADYVRRGAEGEEVGYVFYCAPTVQLLKQSFSNLRKLIGVENTSFLHLVYSNGAIQGNIADRIEALLDGRVAKQYPVVHGSVVFLTHAAFLTLRSHPFFAKTTIFFDEARKWIDLPAKVDLTSGAKEMFDRMFELRDGAGAVWELVPRELAHNQLSHAVVDKASGKAFNKLEDVYSALSSADSRVKVFAVLQNESNKPILLTLTLPSYPFRGFKEVYILSADFETSQMYHLLKKEDMTPVNWTVPFMDEWLPGGYGAAYSSIMNRYRDLTIVPIIDTDAMPSKHAINTALLTPKAKSSALAEVAERLGLRPARIRELIAYRRDSALGNTMLDASDIEFLKAMEEFGCQADMLDLLIRSADEIFNAWREANPGPTQSLLIANNDEVSKRCIEGNFVTLSVGSVEGRNDFQHLDCVSFFAAINPDPFVCQMLNAVLGETGYDAHEDYVVDKAIQSLGRAKTRNRDSHDPVMAIVSTRGLAERIAKRMQGYPRVDSSHMRSLGSLEYWTPTGAEKRLRIEKGDTRSRKDRYLDRSGNRQIESARAQRSKAAKKLQDASTDDQRAKAQADFDKWNATLDELIAHRDNALTEAA